MELNLIAAAVAFCIGVLQVLLTAVLFGAAFSGKTIRMLVSLLGKIAVYGGFFYLLATVLRPAAAGAAIGFGAGFFPGLLMWYLTRGRKQAKGGKNG